jgi:O-antigen/teichoic acid export membrane protein
VNTGRAVLLKGAADIAARGAAVITFPIVARYAGADGYGAYAQMNVIVGFLVPLASLGLGNVMVRFFIAPEWTHSVRRRALRIGAGVLGAGLVVSGLVALLAPLINDVFLRWPEGDELFRWGSLLIVLGAVEFWLLDLFRAREWLISFSAYQLAQTVLLVTAVAVVLPAGYSIVDLVIVTVALKAFAMLAAFGLVVLRAPRAEEPREPIEHATVAQMIRFGFPLTVAGLGLWMVNLSDRLVIGAFMTPDALGLYGAAYTLGSMLLLASAAFFLPAYPRFMSAVVDRDEARLATEMRTFHRYTCLAVVPGAIFLAALMHPALLVLGGSEFDVDIVVGLLIVAGIFIDQWNGLSHYVLAAFDRTVFLQNAWLVAGALNIALNLVAVPLWGLRGAGAATLISFLVLEVAIFHAASKHLDLRRHYRLDTTARAAVAGAIGGAVAVGVLLALGEDLVGTALAAVAFWIVYVGAAFAVRALHRSDIQQLVRAIGVRSRAPVTQG